jgi:hypothetical protein
MVVARLSNHDSMLAQASELPRLEQAWDEKPDRETVSPTTVPLAERPRGRSSGAV